MSCATFSFQLSVSLRQLAPHPMSRKKLHLHSFVSRKHCLEVRRSSSQSKMSHSHHTRNRLTRATRLFQQYKQVVYPLNPHILDLSTFESELVTFLSSIERVKSGQATGTSLPWTAIMFAVIAAGLQFSDLPSNERASGCKCYGMRPRTVFATPDTDGLTIFSPPSIRLFTHGIWFHYSKYSNNNRTLNSGDCATKRPGDRSGLVVSWIGEQTSTEPWTPHQCITEPIFR
jgi:hypothetical protein